MTIKEIANTLVRGEKAYTFPLRYDDYGQVVWDANDNKVLDIRGWGRLQYASDEKTSMALQDDFGKWLVETLNEAYEKSV